jgi:hypothetical protein
MLIALFALTAVFGIPFLAFVTWEFVQDKVALVHMDHYMKTIENKPNLSLIRRYRTLGLEPR